MQMVEDCDKLTGCDWPWLRCSANVRRDSWGKKTSQSANPTPDQPNNTMGTTNTNLVDNAAWTAQARTMAAPVEAREIADRATGAREVHRHGRHLFYLFILFFLFFFFSFLFSQTCSRVFVRPRL
jgi:hypothetical protein